jgi:hypothetical protein
MKKLMMLVAAIVAMCGTTAARAQDITGDWQGTLKVDKGLRIILHIYKGDKDGLSATMYSIDQTPQPIPGTSVTRDGAGVKVAIDMIQGKYDGKAQRGRKDDVRDLDAGDEALFAGPDEGNSGDGVGNSRGAETGEGDGGGCGPLFRCCDH